MRALVLVLVLLGCGCCPTPGPIVNPVPDLECGANLATDSHNCGWCGHDCEPDKGGVCCPNTDPDTVKQTPGLCTILGTSTNCAGCGDRCQLGWSCVGRRCERT